MTQTLTQTPPQSLDGEAHQQTAAGEQDTEQDTAYDIAEVAALTGLTPHTLRYYERAGLVRSPRRDATGRRRYDDRDLSWLRFLTRLRSTGMPIRVVRDYVELCWAGDGNEAERLEILEAHRDVLRERLAQAQHDLEHIDLKIALYRKALP
ncbi:MerR family transcriptional regulator [Motilibacter rhizosphaerae]|uniref:MerR family transcriptional regulator n=1 Tax=Motilibacter rhizosphaerae TaxID=598652 RepID=A0A4Q7NXV3_9ACTN|nr:MerR family transcriptional regulator [Motilibacter rhizosphaerae]RZS91758.1 MerR family transcriptional regulator [Motilibacter rhizosphaerae]